MTRIFKAVGLKPPAALAGDGRACDNSDKLPRPVVGPRLTALPFPLPEGPPCPICRVRVDLRGRPARGLPDRARPDPHDPQDRADRRALRNRPEAHPGRLLRQPEAGARLGGRGRGGEGFRASRAWPIRAVAERAGPRPGARQGGHRDAGSISTSASETFMGKNTNRGYERNREVQKNQIDTYLATACRSGRRR